MEGIEQQSKLNRSNAENLENLCNKEMCQLQQDKRKLKKLYQDEHSKIAAPFHQVSRFNNRLSRAF
jgi:tyrosine-protein kinase Fer